MIELTIWGQTPPKKSGMKIIVNKKTGRPMIIQKETYTTWAKDAVTQIKNHLMDTHGTLPYWTSPVRVKAVIYRHTKRKADLINVLQSICDVLEEAGVILNDFQVKDLDGSRLYLGTPKDRARAEVEISLTTTDPY